MDGSIETLKPVIRSIIMALGRRATEREFRLEYNEVEGESFNKVLQKYKLSFFDFMKKLPDCCKIFNVGGELFVERVSNKDSSHMDRLTIKKGRKAKFRR